jgi:transcription elongation factor GreA
MVNMTKFPMTGSGFTNLQKELKNLLTHQRPAVIEEIAKARKYGDLSENSEYHAALEKQKFIERRIKELEHKIANAQVIDISHLTGPKIVFGAVVTLYDDDKQERVVYQIVGVDEADPKKGKLAINSDLARSLIGKEEGMTIDFVTPRGGEKSYFIEKVSYN